MLEKESKALRIQQEVVTAEAEKKRKGKGE
jgi:hypothetical protein